MKKCDHFKDLILTDYIDGELDKDSAAGVESHLLDCSDCSAFLKEIKKDPLFLARRTLRQPVPAELWDTIKQNIEHADEVNGPLEEFIGKLKGLIVFPRMVPVFASLILMLFAGSMALNTMQVRQAQATDQGEYLVSLLSPTGPSASSDNNDPGSPIEHYFL